MGASNALTKQVRQILGDSAIPVFAPLASTSREEAIEATVQALQSAVPTIASRDRNVLSIPLGPARDGELEQFWQAHGSQIVSQLNERFAAFRRGVEPAVPQARPIAQAIATVTEEVAHPVRTTAAPALSREKLQQDIVQLFAQAMEYPPEVFTDDVALEAELGIDSVKQMELLGKLEQQYRLPARPEDFRLSDYGTLRKITDFVLEAIAIPAANEPVLAVEAARQISAALEPAPSAQPAASKSPQIGRAALQEQIVALFAQAMEYPPEVFTEDVALEAELGIDSVKQMELLGKLEQQFQLPARPEEFRLSDYGTLRKITDFVHGAIGTEQTENPPSAPVLTAAEPIPMPARKPAASAQPAKAAILTRAALQEQIVALFAEAMEYPPEVFTEDVALEAELGIDSVKQMELLGKLEAQYQLPPRSEDFRLSDYGTLCKITDFVHAAIDVAPQPPRQRDPVYAVG
jgi:acyl carrier protein